MRAPAELAAGPRRSETATGIANTVAPKHENRIVRYKSDSLRGWWWVYLIAAGVMVLAAILTKGA